MSRTANAKQLEVSERKRAEYYAHHEERKAKARQYYHDHREECLARNRAYRENNPVYYKEYVKNYYILHREEILERVKANYRKKAMNHV